MAKKLKPTARQIKTAFFRWRGAEGRVPEYHKARCDVLCGSRAEEWECNCGLYKAAKYAKACYAKLLALLKEAK